MTKVISVSSSRADVGILLPIWHALVDQPNVDLHLFFTGMHLAKDADTIPDIPKGVTVHTGGADLGGEVGPRASAALAAITQAAGDLYGVEHPNAILVTGDRLDMLPAAVASLPYNIPLVHLHGGEITEGAVDDRIRHALTKLSHLHCVSTKSARDRLLAMGEEDWRIRVTGAPGLDTLNAAPLMLAEKFASELALPSVAGLRLVTVHPETNAANPCAPLTAVLDALESFPGPTLFTAPNSDPGGADMMTQIGNYVETHAWAYFRETLGPKLYPNALRHAALMIGNSSSGMIEAGFFGLPVINVGDRQSGRDRGTNVIDVPNDTAAVTQALGKMNGTAEKFARDLSYGDGAAGARVAEAITTLPDRGVLVVKRSPTTMSPATP